LVETEVTYIFLAKFDNRVWRHKLAHQELEKFLREQCKAQKLSLRGLSVKAGLSPGTVHHIFHRKYQPTVDTLNKLADALGVKREYLWQVAGLLEDMDYTPATMISDPRLRFHFSRVDKLPIKAKNFLIDVIESLILFLESDDTK
jgi:transcriptional regulator with XRE-family HTH domain